MRTTHIRERILFANSDVRMIKTNVHDVTNTFNLFDFQSSRLQNLTNVVKS